jgi:2-dehydropantoate 2-reductase
MQIGIIGCGAMGSIYAGLLASSGNNVLVVDSNKDHIRAIELNGLRISGASGDRTVTVRAFTEAPAESVDLLVISVKGAHAGGAASSARKMMNAGTIVLTIQNGLGSADKVASELGDERLIVGVAKGFGASLQAPGHSHHNDMNAIKMGAYSGLSFDEVSRVADLWLAAGFDTEAIEDIAAMQWEKLICNVAYSAISALTGSTVGEVLEDQDLAEISRAAAVEAWSVARARGVAIKIDDPAKHVRDFAERMINAKPSVLLDIEAGRTSEIDMINGAIPREAEKEGLSAPVNATLTGLVRALERRTREDPADKLRSKLGK